MRNLFHGVLYTTEQLKKFECLREFEPEFDDVLGYESGAHMGSIHEKNQMPKISCYRTFKVLAS